MRADEEHPLLSPPPRRIDSSSFIIPPSARRARPDDDLLYGPTCPPFDLTPATERIDRSLPLTPANTYRTCAELVAPDGDGETIRLLQHDLHRAVLAKDRGAVEKAVRALSTAGRARNFMAAAGLLAAAARGGTAAGEGAVADRPYDTEFDGDLLQALLDATQIPPSYLQPDAMLRAALSVNDPLLLVTSLEAGADLEALASRVPILKNAQVSGKSYMLEILQAAGLRADAATAAGRRGGSVRLM